MSSVNYLHQTREHLDDLLTYDYEGAPVSHLDILKFAVNFYSTLKYQNGWLEDALLDKLDFRFQTFARIELHTLNYYISLVSTRNDIDNIIRECLDLGYSFEMAFNCATNLREVNLRISFWDRYFYNIEYFVKLMNSKFGFVSDGSTHAKQYYFQAMLKHFGMEAKVYDTKNLLATVNNYFPPGNDAFIALANQKQCKGVICYSKFYEYAAAMRNSLHNNGFSSKTLNNLDLGIISLKDIRKNKSVSCISVFHVTMLSIILAKVIEDVTMKSIELMPGELIEDPYVKQMDDLARQVQLLA